MHGELVNLQNSLRRLEDEREDLKLALDEANSAKSAADTVVHELKAQVKQLQALKRSHEESISLVDRLRQQIRALEQGTLVQIQRTIEASLERHGTNISGEDVGPQSPPDKLTSILNSDQIKDRLSQPDLEILLKLAASKQDPSSIRGEDIDSVRGALVRLMFELDVIDQYAFTGLISTLLQNF